MSDTTLTPEVPSSEFPYGPDGEPGVWGDIDEPPYIDDDYLDWCLEEARKAGYV